jgi:hypothetical protein
VGPVFLEFRDIPNGPSQLELPAARSLRVAARLRGESLAPSGLELQLLSADFVCGDPVPAGAEGVCVVTTVCVLNKQGKELCESEPLLDFDAPPESFQALIEALLVPRIKLAYGLDPSTVLATSKVTEFVKGRVVIGADGVKHAYVAQDVAISAD